MQNRKIAWVRLWWRGLLTCLYIIPSFSLLQCKIDIFFLFDLSLNVKINDLDST